MATVREVLHQYTKKISSRAIAKSFGMSKTTVRKYLQIAVIFQSRVQQIIKEQFSKTVTIKHSKI